MVKKTDRRQRKRFLSVGPITSREKLVHAPRNLTLLRALKNRYKAIRHYIDEVHQLEAAIKALGGAIDE